jgi:hypothetical protein
MSKSKLKRSMRNVRRSDRPTGFSRHAMERLNERLPGVRAERIILELMPAGPELCRYFDLSGEVSLWTWNDVLLISGSSGAVVTVMFLEGCRLGAHIRDKTKNSLG